MQTIDITLPTSWQELTQKQLREVFTLLALDLDFEEIRAMCLMKWTGISPEYSETEDAVIIRYTDEKHRISVYQLTAGIECLAFLDTIPPYPCRLDVIDGCNAVAANFQRVPFELFLFCDNLYQGYLHTKDNALLLDLARALYDNDGLRASKAELVSVFYWFASLKQMFASRFHHFLQPAGRVETNQLSIGEQLQESMDAQIRALTKRDITKEKDILAMDTWRALTELNAQAREYEELKHMKA